MDSTLLSAVTQSHLRTFVAIRMELRSGTTINLIDGSGVVTLPVNGSNVVFTGYDATFGTIASANTIAERMADEAPRFTFTMMPPSEAAMGTLADPLQQGSPVYAWWGLVNDQTGAVIGTPELLWNGRFDSAKVNFDANAMAVEIDSISAFDRLFAAEEGQRLNGVWHQSIWPGETGLDYVYDAQQDVNWGMEAPYKAAVSYGGGYGGGGSYGGAGGGINQNWMLD
jgi:hypothetical protein